MTLPTELYAAAEWTACEHSPDSLSRLPARRLRRYARAAVANWRDCGDGAVVTVGAIQDLAAWGARQRG